MLAGQPAVCQSCYVRQCRVGIAGTTIDLLDNGGLTRTKAPKMLLMAATEGRGTLKIANWRFSLFGMSFLPPPGMFMAAKYLQQTPYQCVVFEHDAHNKVFYVFLGNNRIFAL